MLRVLLTGFASIGLAVAEPVWGASASGEDKLQAVSQAPPSQALSVLPAQAEPAAPTRNLTIPEPMSLAVFGTGLLLLLRRRRF